MLKDVVPGDKLFALLRDPTLQQRVDLPFCLYFRLVCCGFKNHVSLTVGPKFRFRFLSLFCSYQHGCLSSISIRKSAFYSCPFSSSSSVNMGISMAQVQNVILYKTVILKHLKICIQKCFVLILRFRYV